MRLRYPNVVDIAYAGSSPTRFYSEEVGQYDYYRIVTDSAARANASCPDSVREMLGKTIGLPGVTKEQIATGLGLCAPLPPYMEDGDAQLLVDEVSMVASYTFANLNMAKQVTSQEQTPPTCSPAVPNPRTSNPPRTLLGLGQLAAAPLQLPANAEHGPRPCLCDDRRGRRGRSVGDACGVPFVVQQRLRRPEQQAQRAPL
jgi:hypothetical protein